MRSILNDLDEPLTGFSRSLYTCKSNISMTMRLTDKVTIEH